MTRRRHARNGDLMRWLDDHKSYEHDYCLIWPFGRSTSGYGALGPRGYAHRFMCAMAHGPAPDGHQATHSCGRGADGCVNPRHLSWKTPRENQMDRLAHGDTFTGKRPRVTQEQATLIISVRHQEQPAVTAARYGITEACVRQIQTGKTWVWLHEQLSHSSAQGERS